MWCSEGRHCEPPLEWTKQRARQRNNQRSSVFNRQSSNVPSSGLETEDRRLFSLCFVRNGQFRCRRHGECRLAEIAEDGWVGCARRPAVRAPLLDHVLSKLFAAAAFPHGAQVEAVLAQVADLLVPDRAGIQIPVRIEE